MKKVEEEVRCLITLKVCGAVSKIAVFDAGSEDAAAAYGAWLWALPDCNDIDVFTVSELPNGWSA